MLPEVSFKHESKVTARFPATLQIAKRSRALYNERMDMSNKVVVHVFIMHDQILFREECTETSFASVELRLELMEPPVMVPDVSGLFTTVGTLPFWPWSWTFVVNHDDFRMSENIVLLLIRSYGDYIVLFIDSITSCPLCSILITGCC